MPRLTKQAAKELGLAPKRSKYNVDQSEIGLAARRFRGRTYDSKAECEYAKILQMEEDEGGVQWWLPQVPFDLGEDTRYTVDFLVCDQGGHTCHYFYCVDVKGAETAAWRRAKKLWKKYGKFPLHVIRGGKTVEIVEGAPC